MELTLDAELTALSACKTGAGEYFTGEGVMGMSRAFLLAGSRSVLVSLWSVDSKATEELMVAFYRHLRSGTGGPEALRRAKLEMMERRRSERAKADGKRGLVMIDEPETGPQSEKGRALHPFYWAAFILVGR